jgi:hypothetical protein
LDIVIPISSLHDLLRRLRGTDTKDGGKGDGRIMVAGRLIQHSRSRHDPNRPQWLLKPFVRINKGCEIDFGGLCIGSMYEFSHAQGAKEITRMKFTNSPVTHPSTLGSVRQFDRVHRSRSGKEERKRYNSMHDLFLLGDPSATDVSHCSGQRTR